MTNEPILLPVETVKNRFFVESGHKAVVSGEWLDAKTRPKDDEGSTWFRKYFKDELIPQLNAGQITEGVSFSILRN
jgi:hypothetical protein